MCELVGKTTRVSILAIALCSTLVLTACGEEEPPAGTSAAVAVAATPVKVITTGTAPTASLAWFTDSGEQQVTFKATQGLEQKAEGGDGPDPNNLPYKDISLNLPLTASLSTDGELRTNKVTVGTPSGTNTDRNEDIVSAKGFVMTSKQRVDGQVTERSFAAPESASDSARASVESALNQMNDFPIVFPTEPIGVGAKWVVSNRVDVGVSMFQDITYTLTARSNQNVTLKIDVNRRPAVTSFGQTDLTVENVTTESSGQLQLDLTKSLPMRGQIDVATTLTLGQKDSPVKIKQKATTQGQWLPTK